MAQTQAFDVFHAIAHPVRRAILLKLKSGECSAGDLAAPFEMSFPAVSQHLQVLQESHLVSVRKNGRLRVYQLQTKPLQSVASWIEEFSAYFESRLDDLGHYLDAKHGKPAAKPRKRS